MSTWNEIPYDENATPEEKALEFDLQFAENAIGVTESEEPTPQRRSTDGQES